MRLVIWTNAPLSCNPECWDSETGTGVCRDERDNCSSIVTNNQYPTGDYSRTCRESCRKKAGQVSDCDTR